MPVPDEEWWLRWLPLGLLALATAVVVPTAPALGDAAADVRLTTGLAAITALWVGLVPSPTPLHDVGRSALAFALCWLNPLYAIFAYVGFTDAELSLRRRWVSLGVGAAAVTLGGAQSGGLPPESSAQAALFAVLVVVNGGLASAFHEGGADASVSRAATSPSCERLNEELEAALPRTSTCTTGPARPARPASRRSASGWPGELHDTLAQSLAGIVDPAAGATTTLTPVHRAGVSPAGPRGPGRGPPLRAGPAPAPLDGASLPAARRAAWSTDWEARARGEGRPRR